MAQPKTAPRNGGTQLEQPASNIQPRIQRIERSTRGLRDMLFDELDALRNGKTTPQRASAVAKLSSEICNSVRIELYYQRVTAGLPRAGDPMLEQARVWLGSQTNGQEE